MRGFEGAGVWLRGRGYVNVSEVCAGVGKVEAPFIGINPEEEMGMLGRREFRTGAGG